jgi:hypothetical protein
MTAGRREAITIIAETTTTAALTKTVVAYVEQCPGMAAAIVATV